MKQLILIAFFLFTSATMFAQSLSVKLNSRQPNFTARNGSLNQVTSTVDTVNIYVNRATGGTFYGSPDGGYVFGTSYFLDTSTATLYPVTDETGIEFDGIGNATVTDILFWAGAKQITGTPDIVTGKIYTVGADSMPVTLLGSGTINMMDIDTSLSAPTFTDLSITSGTTNITSDFFVSLSYVGNDDTIGFLSTAAGDGMNEKRIRQKASAAFLGTWGRMGDLYPFLDVDLFFAPIVTITGVGINDHFTLKNATLEPVYPSPAKDEVHLDYTLKNNCTVSYCLFDLRGKKYFELKNEQQAAGTYSQTFNTSGLASGNYFLSVSINGNTVNQKVVIAK